MFSIFKPKVLIHSIVVSTLVSITSVNASPIVKVDGSSTVFPITEAVAEDFQTAKKGAIRVTVGISGTGGGFKKFCRNEIDVVNASRPITVAEMEACKEQGVQFIEMPIAYDALTVVVNPKNTWSKTITVEELKKIWEPAAQGTITQWNQINPAWPEKKIKLYGAGADSGTFEYFTEAIVGKAKSSRGDFTASEDDNVLVQGVASDIYALGFFGFAYYTENSKRVTAVAVDSGTGGVLPSAATVENNSYKPLSRPIFIYINAKSADKPEVDEFVKFYMSNAEKLVTEVKYFPLSKEVYHLNLEHMQKRKLGTVFKGSGVNIKLEDILKLESSL
ncbi:MAG TPA: PstS family phosphate ABC transporter substrate-binding protein [Nitrosomonas sp.]|nr:PstS family phosphate ABC transporter substrate-binding protein [Nitrosomonas sp.]HQX14363.1 PstS family phosphate ABC transporter substrate-binding protein [Nitrosomonas sp.]HRB20310.1 PstS family phosphate ABC transporter substrate-binding protein [Nitrosomonas sp.]HRB33660.1 PstS family phosphate ABC transporter substrate-binding protein [Nitrosomonas sp.]HRB46427.1 PstS family phosphate ABC transporter substrate-binding protein [Nitrosomonas sp.]